MSNSARFLFSLLVIAALFTSTRATAQGPPAQVLQRIAAAHGNRWTSGEISDWVADGRLTVFSTQGPRATYDLTLQEKGTRQVQRIVKQPGGILKQGTDGSNSWESAGGFFTLEAHGTALDFIESQTSRSTQRFLNHQAEGITLRDLGSDGKARVIEASDEHGKKTKYTVDENTSIIGKVEFVTGQTKDPFNGRPADRIDTYVFSDYRMVQGALMPFRIERFNDGIKTEDMQFTNVRFNAGLKDQDFKR